MRTHEIFLPILAITLALSAFHSLHASQDFDFFYFVLQWPGSYCDTTTKCCYPTTGKPAADFGIHGLWPNYNDGSYPSNCDPYNPFDASQIGDLKSSMQKEWPTLACPSGDGSKFWEHEWNKHGTCAEDLLDQHQYFEAALALKKRANLLDVLKSSGIEANGGLYSMKQISSAIKEGLNVTAGVECNRDVSGNTQLYQVYLCVDSMALGFIDCPLLPNSKCNANTIEFPPF